MAKTLSQSLLPGVPVVESPLFGSSLDDMGLRVQDGWRTNSDIRAIARNAMVLDLLAKPQGRRAFQFQTLNFPVGTQQHYHSDSIHFSSIPKRFMCGVWVALEDIHPDAGPLACYPGSHKWPVLYNDLIGKMIGGETDFVAQAPYKRARQAMVEASGVQPEISAPAKAYCTPAYSDPLIGNLDLRDIVDISTGEPVPNL